jgi:hypothetical protein
MIGFVTSSDYRGQRRASVPGGKQVDKNGQEPVNEERERYLSDADLEKLGAEFDHYNELVAGRLGWRPIPRETNDYLVGYRWLKPNGYKTSIGPVDCLIHAFEMLQSPEPEIGSAYILDTLGLNYLMEGITRKILPYYRLKRESLMSAPMAAIILETE